MYLSVPHFVCRSFYKGTLNGTSHFVGAFNERKVLSTALINFISNLIFNRDKISHFLFLCQIYPSINPFNAELLAGFSTYNTVYFQHASLEKKKKKIDRNVSDKPIF